METEGEIDREIDGVRKVHCDRVMAIQHAGMMHARKKMEGNMEDECPPIDEQLNRTLAYLFSMFL